ncbi:dihydrolipoyl dehydrogenase [Salipiger sp. IMCC34102]|uniref:dihydrolipoyl dehydrogenase n=1 Tax=Salipiger sp. IMCC34102 TaxID=2510647 RepID=UPI00101B671F|nr:dihydrolipoyl dehydrogenase [Salipiger sp. IMCC34102]RYH00778.1 dihydrolipoyl dehydrogenase [Salipiger sp. IMCC34102]
MTHHVTDVVVIGAGTAGLAAERSARAEGARTLLVDEAFRGTLCANTGCMPSKLLIAAANAAHAARGTDTFGITTTGVTVDGPAVLSRVRRERDKFVEATRASYDELPDGTCIKALARFTGPTTLALDNGDTVEARAVVIATGSKASIPGPFEGLGDLALTNESIFEIPDLPRSLAVIGGGAIGLELAQAMVRLGVRTELFDHAETLGGAQNPDVQSALSKIMGQELPLHLGVDVEAEREGDQVRLTWSGPAEGSRTFDRVLVATGRPPRLDGLDLEATGLDLDDHGVPVFDRNTMQCGDAPIFMAGDANADAPVLHDASNEGSVAGRNAVKYPVQNAPERTPAFAITFSDPPLAIIGDPAEAESVVGCASYADQGRAKVEDRAKGLVRIFAAPDGRLTGAELFCPGADHMAHLLIYAIQRGDTATDLLGMPFYHPTLEEGLKSALRDICTRTSTAMRADRDFGDAPGA